jgi:hypothetical protein
MESTSMKQWRKVISLTALVAFIFMILSSIILYIEPEGRVAYWSDWHLWGMSKTDWANIHINLGVLFLIAMILHTYLNWTPIVSYLRTKSKTLRIFTKDFNIALVITALVILGTYWMVPPFSTVINIGDAFKAAGSEKYGEPPYGHAELSSLQVLVRRMGWDLDEARRKLAAAGIDAPDPNVPFKEIALKNRLTPQQVFLAMAPEEPSQPQAKLPLEHPAGLGKIVLGDFCQKYQLETDKVIAALKAKNIAAQADKNFKDIAEQHQMAPSDLYLVIKEIIDGPGN